MCACVSESYNKPIIMFYIMMIDVTCNANLKKLRLIIIIMPIYSINDIIYRKIVLNFKRCIQL